MAVILALLLASCSPGDTVAFELDYDEMVMLDAEALAEGGIAEAYSRLLPKLRRYVEAPAELTESVDDKVTRYGVTYRGREYVIYSPELDDDSWGRATFVLFSIVNDQLSGADHRFFAINGGNDLGGMFLTPAEVEAAKASLPRKTDWPYIPTAEAPWHGQPHD